MKHGLAQMAIDRGFAENANEENEQSAAQIYGFFIDSWPALHGLWA